MSIGRGVRCRTTPHYRRKTRRCDPALFHPASDSRLVCLENRCRRFPDLILQLFWLDRNQLPGIREDSLDENFQRGFRDLEQFEHRVVRLPDNLLLLVEWRCKDGIVNVLVEFQRNIPDWGAG